MAGQLNTFAETGFSKAAAYDAHRPSFPTKSVNVLLENVRVAGFKEARVVDLAAGTGKFTELLAKRDEQYNITAVEPHKDMRQVLEEKSITRVTVKEGLATSIPLEDESQDGVIAAQVGFLSEMNCLMRTCIPARIIFTWLPSVSYTRS